MTNMEQASVWLQTANLLPCWVKPVQVITTLEPNLWCIGAHRKNGTEMDATVSYGAETGAKVFMG